MSDDARILVGKIVAAQGLRGDLRVQTFTRNPADFQGLHLINHQSQIINHKFVRSDGSVAIIKIDGVDDRTAAEKLRGTELFVNRGDLPELPEGEFYHADLLGMRVGDRRVAGVHDFGAGDILELDDGTMVSFAGAVVDTEKREILI
ncbi:MAG: ribosome maturation factor RimM [Rickettsiales bacterium]|jgi:16S rRNA processing protein RimM|nr:ribosome maturation factor RimM [Rickettsiales bacterium]